MSAAHELIERGFEVVVLESGDIAGGKARSIPVIHEGEDTSGHQLADTALGRRSSTGCPASTGFDSSPASTSTSSTPCAAYRRLTGARWRITWCRRHATGFTQYDKPTFVVPAGFPRSPRDAGTMLRDILLAFGPVHWPHSRRSGVLRRALLADPHLVRRAPARRVRADELVGVRRRRAAVGVIPEVPRHRHYALAGGLQGAQGQCAHHRRHLRAADAHDPRIRSAGSTDRVLDGPTNLVWIDPWLAAISNREGCSTSRTREVEEILCENGRITGVVARQQGQRTWCMATTTWRRSRSSASPPW